MMAEDRGDGERRGCVSGREGESILPARTRSSDGVLKAEGHHARQGCCLG